MISMVDRLVAASAGMAGALYFMAAAVAWFRVVFPVPSASFVAKVIFDRAVAWSALSALFILVVVVKLTSLEWDDTGVDVILMLASLAVFVAGLVSVRSITLASFGSRVLMVFAAVSVAVGILIFLI